MQSEYIICDEYKKVNVSEQGAIISACLRLEIWYSEIVTITSRHHLTEELRGAVGDGFVPKDDIARQHRDAYLEQETIHRIQWPALLPDVNSSMFQTL
ncbi:hypothetical protein TNCV_1496961 [Trichonephila clavipes]|nr:hypothetical protein TNCV_1496961 [Trichonephila clavipes]